VTSKRVELSTPTLADADEFLAVMRRSRALHRPWLYPPLSEARYAAYLERIAQDRYEGFIARRREDGAIVGWLNVSEIVRGSLQGAFLGYGGVAGFDGHGYMTDALGLVVRRAFTTLRLHRLEANIQPGNRASTALVRRCGFEREGFSPRYLKVGGRWRDHERWALRAETWRAARAEHRSSA
jgi:ribosomal-protein-alanine N-acetyltransferase